MVRQFVVPINRPFTHTARNERHDDSSSVSLYGMSCGSPIPENTRHVPAQTQSSSIFDRSRRYHDSSSLVKPHAVVDTVSTK
jgi:hypothetical protein